MLVLGMAGALMLLSDWSELTRLLVSGLGFIV
jgi:hypothetical protein